jgi:hypothetical protein
LWINQWTRYKQVCKKKTEEEVMLSLIGDDAQLRVFCFLDLNTLCKCGSTCKRLVRLEQTCLHQELMQQVALAAPIQLLLRELLVLLQGRQHQQAERQEQRQEHLDRQVLAAESTGLSARRCHDQLCQLQQLREEQSQRHSLQQKRASAEKFSATCKSQEEVKDAEEKEEEEEEEEEEDEEEEEEEEEEEDEEEEEEEMQIGGGGWMQQDARTEHLDAVINTGEQSEQQLDQQKVQLHALRQQLQQLDEHLQEERRQLAQERDQLYHDQEQKNQLEKVRLLLLQRMQRRQLLLQRLHSLPVGLRPEVAEQQEQVCTIERALVLQQSEKDGLFLNDAQKEKLLQDWANNFSGTHGTGSNLNDSVGAGLGGQATIGTIIDMCSSFGLIGAAAR